MWLAADSKWMWSVLNVKGTGEYVCYLCDMPRSDYGQELDHPQFKCSIFDLACRYLTTLFTMQLLVIDREQSGLLPWSLVE